MLAILLIVLSLDLINCEVVTLRLRGRDIANDSYVDVDDIGGSDDDSLHCVTNKTDCCKVEQENSSYPIIEGDWYYPNNTRVESINASNETTKFVRNRGDSVVRLLRYGTPIERGRFYCEIPDANNVTQTIYVNICNDDVTSEDQKNLCPTTSMATTSTNPAASNTTSIVAAVTVVLIIMLILLVLVILLLIFWFRRHKTKTQQNINVATTYSTLQHGSGEDNKKLQNLTDGTYYEALCPSPSTGQTEMGMQSSSTPHSAVYSEIDKPNQDSDNNTEAHYYSTLEEDAHNTIIPNKGKDNTVDHQWRVDSSLHQQQHVPDDVGDTYAVVDMSKKKRYQNKENSKTEQNLEEMYAVVDKKKKVNSTEDLEDMVPSQADQTLDEMYAVVDKKKKKVND